MSFKRIVGTLEIQGNKLGVRLETLKGQIVDLEIDSSVNAKYVYAMSRLEAPSIELKEHKDKMISQEEIDSKKMYRNITTNKLWADKALEFVENESVKSIVDGNLSKGIKVTNLTGDKLFNLENGQTTIFRKKDT